MLGRIGEEARIAIDRIHFESHAREQARVPARARGHVEHGGAGPDERHPSLHPGRRREIEMGIGHGTDDRARP